jgi:hypothetical protein
MSAHLPVERSDAFALAQLSPLLSRIDVFDSARWGEDALVRCQFPRRLGFGAALLEGRSG